MPLDLDNNEPVVAPTDNVSGDADREGAMAKADLFKLANYSHKLFQQIHDEDQLEAWVQAKITKAADYIASVYHYMEYEMKFSEYGKALDDSDVLSESQKVAIKTRLIEAKEKVKELKKAQADKIAKSVNSDRCEEDTLEEGILSGGEQPCSECGGTGVVHVPGRAVPEETKAKVQKYNRLMKASKAAHKRMDANHNGIPDDEEMEEGFEAGAKPGSTFKTKTGVATKTKTGLTHQNTSFKDEGDEIASNAKSGKGTKSHAKAMSAAEKKERAPALKKSKTGTWGMEAGEKFDNRKKEKAVDETYGQGVYEGEEPSAGLSKAKKSATVKKAKAGKDIGKSGKNFDKVAKAAGGGKKGEKIAAAAMWKNIKETTSYLEEKKKLASKDYDGDGKIESGKDEHAGAVDNAIKASKKETVKESADMNRLKELTSRLLG